VAADIEQQERLDNPGSPILDVLRQLGGLPEKGFPAPDRKLGAESMSVAWFRAVIEKASSDQLEQLRRDCRAIDRLAAVAAIIDWRAAQPLIQSAVRSITGDHLKEPPSVRARKDARKRPPVPGAVRFLLSLWDELEIRAVLIPSLLAIRLSPEHGKRLTETIALAAWALELASRLPAPSP
jgi:hypothetical protein